MNLLAFDTSTETLSIGVSRSQAGQERVWHHSGAGGAQASATLIPQALALLGQAGLALRELDAVVFGCGPGSFTGLRTACSVAQGLAYGAGVPVLPVDTLLAVAEEARHAGGATDLLALLDARMDEVYSADYRFSDGRWRQGGDFRLTPPQDIRVTPGQVLAGNAFAAYGARLPAGVRQIEALPTALALLRLAPGLLAEGQAVAPGLALPRYIRDKVAKTTQERADERLAAALRPTE
ncbi:MAG: tRNA (adenosine(37)-N6)-threonylcarbamoyltransferase complex dimerization subunit type 1 TsaB [Ramlibacter sp.]|nr:tRNA (adenosine(37)-N6)-threonylcarbamoyltransferase complex dimerization subunit type 1 TsaB [Ramlibacter sp.]